jgi:ribosomal protein S18 acetylase RimI-like enzyme
VLNLRRATAADVPLMTRVAEQAYAPYVQRMNGQRPAPMDADYAALVAAAEAWVAETGGTVIGFLILIGATDRMLLDAVAVLPSHQGLGTGRALLTLAEEQARAQGYRRISLYTNEAMVENQRWYQRIGYVQTHRGDNHGFARVFYEKALAD